MIKALVHRPGHPISDQVDLKSLRSIRADREVILWLDIPDPRDEDMELLKQEFGFHPLAVEDVLRPHQRPKVEEYGDHYFLVFYSARLSEPKGQIQLTEIDIFVGQNYLVTLHRGEVKEIAEGRRRWEEGNGSSAGQGVGHLLYSLLDSLVDDYFKVMDGVVDRAGGLEEQVIKGASQQTVQDIFTLKKRLLAFRRVVGPERDAVNVLMREDLPFFDSKTVVYLRDIYDHLVRITDAADLYSDLLTSALDVHLSSISNRLNQIMKTLTSWTIILMSLALVAGVYGMNFRNMPELEWQYGYPYALGLMAAIGVGLYVYFKGKDWL